ncbi:helix-turn-helix domain-containing protein [Actinoplanes sp. NPDC049596]|uniref:TetR/AcrR family transcriptional regulator n=1 Tax=unclassified Actinoplanes TaxID=2626549 RepID=UPI0034246224
MGRWEPNARDRLQRAALELYGSRGYEQTTVAEIAARAGLTERTFFRHFADKREVLFAGSSQLEELLVKAVADAPAGLTPMGVIMNAFDTAGEYFPDVTYPRARNAVITANPELMERELRKLARLASALAGALGVRGVSEADAIFAAEAGVLAFRVAFSRWVSDDSDKPLISVLRRSFADLQNVVAGI